MRIPVALSLNSSAAEQQLPQQFLDCGFHTFPQRYPCPNTDKLRHRSRDLWHLFPFSQRKSILWDGPQDFLSPAEGAAAGWKTAKPARRAAEKFLWAVPLSLLLLGLKEGRNGGDLPIPHPPFQKEQQLPTVPSISLG